MKEEIKKMNQFSNAVRFLEKYNLTTLAEVKEYKENAIQEINKLKGKRENLWSKHKQVKTDKKSNIFALKFHF